ncbi:transglutaminase-like domain-containing protein [Paenibacillus methanolicus]|uniref:Transglutaminase superfamily protein n=1 Tax=Paenibacillus methanolicus TaxID=582686 RepID=A0A5S5CLH7_9BACL|nr:transglutaminase-like domain-containing protein [Paenibacillus methanolicus]TYP79238.1 transglutaminase superfamily protein [Paenibacillus methanolicus]
MTMLHHPVFSMDQETMERIERKFEAKAELAKSRARQLLGVFEQALTAEESWALKFLFAYMPVNDLADYDGELFLSHVRRTLQIRELMPWGPRVPDHLFLHFVLPYRVNTEDIEDSRGILHAELADRTKHLSMAEAILETNYWCHEKATYIGSDLRTLSPLSMIRNARGRCGEESTLAVAALRSIGIPARQVYTPRWAHCDDNHAWVEAWADGQWHYFGACEPEARLDQGWFTPPARRAMLVNTRIFANYPGPEAITLAADWFTEINLLANYARTRTITVRVNDEQGRPVAEADVHFEVYNYAELYPLATLPTNGQGEAVFMTGFGDLVVRAVKAGKWGESFLSAAQGDRIELVLDRTEQTAGTIDIDLIPPAETEGDPQAPLNEEQIARHERRLEEGTKLRAVYEGTFMSEADAAAIAGETGLPAEQVWEALRKARGNSREIAAFLQENAAQYGIWTLRILEGLNEKDLTDTFRETLRDHLIGSLAVQGDLSEPIFERYVLCPRVLYEMLVPYKRYFQEAFTKEQTEAFRADPGKVARLLDEDFELWEDLPNLKGKGNPVGAFELMRGDAMSRNILFVSICRSLGIAARLHPSEQKPQYLAGEGRWADAIFAREADGATQEITKSGTLILLKDPHADDAAPAASYAENFSFARLENGFYKTLLLPHGTTDVYDAPIEAEAGAYRIITGVRLKDGSVRARLAYVNVLADEETRVTLTYRKAAVDLPDLGALRTENTFTLPNGKARSFGELIGRQGAIAAWIEPEREPSKHLLRELGELSEAYAQTGAPIIIVVEESRWSALFEPAQYPKLPSTAVFVKANGANEDLPDFIMQQPASEAGYPHLFVMDQGQRIRYAASGYKIGTGKEALQALARVMKLNIQGGDQA